VLTRALRPCAPRALAIFALLLAGTGAPFACGDGGAQGGAAPDAADEVFHPPRHLDAGAEAAPIDAPDEYTSQAAHCMRAADAGAPDPFDAGVDGPPDALALPQVQNLGGPTLQTPTFVSVTFPGDTLADPLEDFVASLGCTDYWRTIGADYGVGDAVASTPVRLAEQAPATIDDLQVRAWLAKKIDGGDPQFPRPAPGTIYVVFYPDSTEVTLQGGTSCRSFGGYHEGGQLADGTPFSYAVIPRCPSGGRDQTSTLTVAVSHELIEACTDPQPDGVPPSYAVTDANHIGWALLAGAEVGDMCEFANDAYYAPPGFPWTVQRIWSNSAAWAGASPCVPASSPGYFYAAAVPSDAVTLNLTGTPQAYAMIHVPVGGSATVPVRLFASGGGTMNVQAIDPGPQLGQPQRLSLSLDAASGAGGATLHLTIQKLKGDSVVGAEPFQLLTTMNGRQTVNWGVTSD
jgi:hypothetical protein